MLSTNFIGCAGNDWHQLAGVHFRTVITRRPGGVCLESDGLDAPTDAQIAAMREELGLNRPIYVQYFGWFVQVLHGNFGSSYITGKDILHELCCVCR